MNTVVFAMLVMMGITVRMVKNAFRLCGNVEPIEQNDCLDIDECDSSPCQHGSCTDGVNEYNCACDAGYDGDNCENGKKKTFFGCVVT